MFHYRKNKKPEVSSAGFISCSKVIKGVAVAGKAAAAMGFY